MKLRIKGLVYGTQPRRPIHNLCGPGTERRRASYSFP
jgi:hypothetical protein